MTEEVASKADRLFDLIWENDIGLGNIIVDDFSIETLYQFVQRWQADVADGGDKAAADDMQRSVALCPEVSGFSSIEGTIPLTFAHCAIRNTIAYHRDIFKDFEGELDSADKGKKPTSNDMSAFLACLESTAALPIAKCDDVGNADVIYSANNWIWAFRSAVQRLVSRMANSGQYDKDLRLIIPVIGLEFEYKFYEEILHAIKYTSLQDRVCYVVFAEPDAFRRHLKDGLDVVDELLAEETADKLFVSTFTHEIS